MPLYIRDASKGPIVVQAVALRVRFQWLEESEDRRLSNDTVGRALDTEERGSRRPTSEQIQRLFSHAERHVILKRDETTQVGEPKFTDLQNQVLRLLGIPLSDYRI